MDLSTLMPQQRDIVTTLDRPLFVSAGAGSGKTFTLTRRILWALSPESGPFVSGLDQVLAITFTKDAAAEIRERVRAALIDEGMAEAALTVDDAWISTIHGMCSRILREHALELGVDPEFSVLEDTDELMDAAVDHVLSCMGTTGAGTSGAQGSIGHVLSWYPLRGEAGMDGREAGTSVSKLVRRLLELACTLPNGMDDVHMLSARMDFSGLADAARAIRSDFGSSKAAERAAAILEAIDAFEESERTADDVLRCMMACEMPRAQGKVKEAVNLLKAEAAEAFVGAYVAACPEATRELMELARAVEGEYSRLKSERSLLDNNDLLRLTYRALRDNEGIRSAYAHRFKMVMIDEFQDTDQMQVDLISYLTGEGGRALCTVGDAQQSIYRFRGAEVEVFRRSERAIRTAQQAAGDEGGRVVQLVKNFRSHAEVLEYVARVFDGENGGLMQGFLDLQAHDGRRDTLVADASRRSALLVVGGTTDERCAAKAAAIARRFRALADAGQDVGGMVLLLGGMTRAGVYADAFRAEGLDCVIAGGSVFASTDEVAAVRALVCALANPADTAQGLMPLLASDMFALGAQELLALCTSVDKQTGETRRRNLDAGIWSDEDAPGLDGLPLVARARAVLRRAWRRVGRDPFATIARDVVNESGWMARLAAKGPQGKAVAANVLKALDALAEAQAELGCAPRSLAMAFDRFLAGKQAPGALNEEGGSAVRIMTVHASKGLEFPVVAVSECFSVRANSDRFQTRRGAGSIEAAALPAQLPGVRMADGSWCSAADVKKRFDKLLGSVELSQCEDVCATGSVLEAYLSMREEDTALDLAERARLLYVAMTRARELCLLAMDEPAGRGRGVELTFDETRDLTGAVLDRILPRGTADLGCDRLVFDNARPGDFELIALRPFRCGGVSYDMTVVYEDQPADAPDGASPESVEPDSFTLAWPHEVAYAVAPEVPRARDAYSYSSLSSALHAEADEKEAFCPVAGALAEGRCAEEPSVGGVIESEAIVSDGVEDPTALGSAFHAAAQWLIETGLDRVPAARVDALARYWSVTPSQRERLEEALGRWCTSSVRRELLAWPLVRAEVPFFSKGLDDEEIRARFGVYAQGAIDALATDPAVPDRALVIDYKTGGSRDETDEELQEKHALQARVYADVLHRAGYAHVTLKFVRVEIPDPQNESEPQVVTYEL